jgi:hypothetical protein
LFALVSVRGKRTREKKVSLMLVYTAECNWTQI